MLDITTKQTVDSIDAYLEQTYEYQEMVKAYYGVMLSIQEKGQILALHPAQQANLEANLERIRQSVQSATQELSEVRQERFQVEQALALLLNSWPELQQSLTATALASDSAPVALARAAFDETEVAVAVEVEREESLTTHTHTSSEWSSISPEEQARLSSLLHALPESPSLQITVTNFGDGELVEDAAQWQSDATLSSTSTPTPSLDPQLDNEAFTSETDPALSVPPAPAIAIPHSTAISSSLHSSSYEVGGGSGSKSKSNGRLALTSAGG